MKQYSYSEAVEMCIEWHEKKMVPREVSDSDLSSLLEFLVSGVPDRSRAAENTLTVARVAYRYGFLRQAGLLFSSILETDVAPDSESTFADAVHHRGKVFFLTGQLDEAWECATRALELCQHQGSEERQVGCLLAKRQICSTRGLRSEANDLLGQAQCKIANGGSDELSSELLFQQGILLHYSGNRPEAQRLIEQVLDVATQGGDRALQCRCLLQLGAVHKDDGEPRLACELTGKATTIARENRLRIHLIAALSNIGSYYLDLDQTKNAKRVLREAGQLLDETGAELYRAGFLAKRANLAWSLARYNTCLELSEESLKIAKRVGHPQNEADAQCAIGMALEVREEYEQAMIHLNESLRLHDKYQLIRNRNYTENAIAKIEAKQKAGDATP